MKRKSHLPKITFILLLAITAIFTAAFAQQNAQDAFDLGLHYLQQGDLDKAVFYFSTAIQIDPKFSQAYNDRGIAYQGRGYYSQAIQDYTKTIQLDPNNAQAYNNRAISYYFQQQYDKAWEDVRKAQKLGLQIKPDFLEALKKASGTSK